MNNGTFMRRRRVNGLFRQKNYSSILMYSVGGLVVLLLQTAPNVFPTFWYARPTPLTLYVVFVSMFEGAKAGALIGTVSGVLWGLYSFRLFGFDALLLLAIGLTAGLLVEWLLRANFLSAALLGSCAVLLQALLEWLFTYVVFDRENLFSILFQVYLPNCLYTVILIPLMYWGVLWMARRIRRTRD